MEGSESAILNHSGGRGMGKHWATTGRTDQGKSDRNCRSDPHSGKPTSQPRSGNATPFRGGTAAKSTKTVACDLCGGLSVQMAHPS